MNQLILKVTNLDCGYLEEKHILKDVSFEVEDGEFLGIIGANGCGKTTLLRAICGILKYTKGSIRIRYNEIASLSRREIAKRIALIPQLTEPSKGITVEEMVMLGRTPHLGPFSFERQIDYKIVDEAIAEVGLEKLRHALVNKLSGGEFQRTIIARSLAQAPMLLLLDEPTSHLDIRFQIKVLRLLRKLRGKRAMLATFHDLNLAARYCTHLILMKKGEIIAQGLPEEVLTQENIWKTFRVKIYVERKGRKLFLHRGEISSSRR